MIIIHYNTQLPAPSENTSALPVDHSKRYYADITSTQKLEKSTLKQDGAVLLYYHQ